MGTILLWTLELNRMKEPLILLLYFQVHVWGKHTTINLYPAATSVFHASTVADESA